MTVAIHHGDCLDVLRRLADEGVRFDACATDPPYHLTSIVKRFGAKDAAAPKSDGPTGVYGRMSAGFRGHAWDGGDIAFRSETWELVRAVMKPGAFLVAFSAARTYHRMTVAIEDAGFLIHPMCGWIFATGMPKGKKIPGAPGWHYGQQALKPALEPICVAQVPMEGTGPENWRAHGVGGFNIGACRIPTEGGGPGRWPATILHDGSEVVEEAFAAYGDRGAAAPAGGPTLRGGNTSVARGRFNGLPADQDPAFHGDSGSASRFFFSSKAGREDRWGSRHATVKPVELMKWLVRIVCPPGGLILDPFAGSGTTGVAALAEGMRAVLIEREPEYAADIEARIAHYQGRGAHRLSAKNRKVAPSVATGADLPLFGG